MAAFHFDHKRQSRVEVALDDISATEWRYEMCANMASRRVVALDDISATEWRWSSTLSFP